MKLQPDKLCNRGGASVETPFPEYQSRKLYDRFQQRPETSYLLPSQDDK